MEGPKVLLNSRVWTKMSLKIEEPNCNQTQNLGTLGCIFPTIYVYIHINDILLLIYIIQILYQTNPIALCQLSYKYFLNHHIFLINFKNYNYFLKGPFKSIKYLFT